MTIISEQQFTKSEYTWQVKIVPTNTHLKYVAYQYDTDTWAVFENDYCLDDLVSTNNLISYCTELMNNRYPSTRLNGSDTWEEFIQHLFANQNVERNFIL